MKNKIYCIECKFFRSAGWVEHPETIHQEMDIQERCTHIENIHESDTYKEKTFFYKKFPSEINAKNNCEWFEKGEYRRCQNG